MADMTQQPIAGRKTATAAVISAVIDFGLYPCSKIEVVVNSSVATTYTVEGSIDGITYRDTSSITVGAGDVGNDIDTFFDNAYRYMRVASTDVGNHIIEIAGTR